MLLRSLYVICSRKLSSYLTSTLLLQNQYCLLLQNCDRLTTLLPVIYAQPLGDDKVRDRCHIVGNYRGSAHNECNVMHRISTSGWKLPVVIHNLKGHDGHLIVKALKSEFGKVQVIPQNMEKYFSLTVGELKFIDFFQFTFNGLDVLAKALADDEFRYLRESCTSNHFGLIRRKGVYPYDYMDSFNRFDETKLPSEDAFFSKLSGSPCSDSSIHTQLECGLPLNVGQRKITMTSTCSWMCCS